MNKLTETLANHVKATIERSEDPKFRIITEVRVEKDPENEFLNNVIVTSNCDGWAEDTDKVLLTTIKNIDVKDLKKYIGLSEEYCRNSIIPSEIDELVNALEYMYEHSEASEEDECGSRYFKQDDVTDYAELLCCGELITSGGGCNWGNIHILKEKGYDVFAGDKDSFGWLTGCVQKDGDNRILVYG